MNPPRKMDSPIVVVVEGIIAAGKTSLIEQCLCPLLTVRGYRVTVVNEPVEKWKKNGRLKLFYDDPARRGFQFQTVAFHDRVMETRIQHAKHNKTTDIYILERSIFSDTLFMKMLRDLGHVDETEYEDYMNLWTMWSMLMPFSPDVFIYLKPGVDLSMKRLKNRAREGETGISEDYQSQLEAKHEDLLGGDTITIEIGPINGEKKHEKIVPILKLTTEDDFRTNEAEQKRIVDLVQKTILSLS